MRTTTTNRKALESTPELRDAAYDLYMLGNSRDLIRWHLGVSETMVRNEVKLRGDRPNMQTFAKVPLRNRRLVGGEKYKHLIVDKFRALYGP